MNQLLNWMGIQIDELPKKLEEDNGRLAIIQQIVRGEFIEKKYTTESYKGSIIQPLDSDRDQLEAPSVEGVPTTSSAQQYAEDPHTQPLHESPSAQSSAPLPTPQSSLESPMDAEAASTTPSTQEAVTTTQPRTDMSLIDTHPESPDDEATREAKEPVQQPDINHERYRQLLEGCLKRYSDYKQQILDLQNKLEELPNQPQNEPMDDV